jgi:CheY-like chemotaxis protein
LRGESDKAVLTVEDTGPGIPPEMREAIFERFRQVDSSSTRRHGGTGLGLAIVKEFVSLHQGSVSVSEAAGGGARFSVEVPLAAPPSTEVQGAEMPPDEEDARAAVAELEGRAAHSEPGNSLRADAPLVLVVEDNPEMNDFVVRSLADHCRMVRAFDGQEGLEKAQSLRPDLIISDIMIPVRCRGR